MKRLHCFRATSCLLAWLWVGEAAAQMQDVERGTPQVPVEPMAPTAGAPAGQLPQPEQQPAPARQFGRVFAISRAGH